MIDPWKTNRLHSSYRSTIPSDPMRQLPKPNIPFTLRIEEEQQREERPEAWEHARRTFDPSHASVDELHAMSHLLYDAEQIPLSLHLVLTFRPNLQFLPSHSPFVTNETTDWNAYFKQQAIQHRQHGQFAEAEKAEHVLALFQKLAR